MPEEDQKRKAFVVKVGGSIFDKDEDEPESKVLENIAEQVVGLFLDGHRLILTCGGGPVLDIFKDRRDQRQLTEQAYNTQAAGAVEANCKHLREIIGNTLRERKGYDDRAAKKSATYIVKDRSLENVLTNGALRRGIPIIGYAQKLGCMAVLGGGAEVPETKSDVHTLVIAEFVARYFKDHGQQVDSVEVHFVKDTDGVYMWDPKLEKAPEGREREENKRQKRVSAERFVRSIDLSGADGRGDHLIEMDAALYLGDNRYIKEIVGIRIYGPSSMKRAITLGHDMGSLVYNSNHPMFETWIQEEPGSKGTTTMSRRLRKK